MRITRIHCPELLPDLTSLELGNAASLHVCKVLRLKSGDTLILFDGKGYSVTATLDIASNKKAVVKIGKSITENTESNLTLHLGLGMSKGDRMDYAIQKAVEVGVTHITPLLTKFSVIKLDHNRRQKKRQHWSGIVIHACEQSGRTTVPIVNPITDITDWVDHSAEHKIVFAPDADTTLSQLKPADTVSVLIGPEGGLSATEIDLALAHKFKQIKLGPRILRTETAAVVACGAIQTVWGDFAN
ncbi:16S rRNA (uracil(1498)-N(3))-methyltransferase [hydrothermal vent metagenome]|uniref:16S rRNA (uracil(1498)-N(3))-methyltransferase n=1 Tax=hydrothermal vent metagenome TaxID=652676 RepID=A0A3B1A3X2_9ZZZZ